MPPGYLITTKKRKDDTIDVTTEDSIAHHHDVVALDCEMVKTAQGVLELARLTLIDAHGSVLLDELVKPHEVITDYLTQYSGITPAMLEHVTTRCHDVRQRVMSLIDADTVVVMHSGENDLHALKLVHCKVVDTAVLYSRGGVTNTASAKTCSKISLQTLAHVYLNRKIQQQGGHDSVEDATTALDLALLRVRLGPSAAVIFDGSTKKKKKKRKVDARRALVDVLSVDVGAVCCVMSPDVGSLSLVLGGSSSGVAYGGRQSRDAPTMKKEANKNDFVAMLVDSCIDDCYAGDESIVTKGMMQIRVMRRCTGTPTTTGLGGDPGIVVECCCCCCW